MNEFTKQESTMLKAIGLIFMVCLHLYNREDIVGYYTPLLYIGGKPLIYYISFIFDACVPIFLFSAGYAAYIQKDRSFRSRISRLFKLILNFWIVLILTCIMGFLFKSNDIPGGLLKFVGNLSLINISYVGAWWFMQTYVILILIAPILIKIIEKQKIWMTIIINIIIYMVGYYFRFVHIIDTSFESINMIINALVLLGTSLISFNMGIVFKQRNVISKIRNRLQESYTNIVGICLFVGSIVLHIIVKSIFVAPFIAMFVIVSFALLRINDFFKRILLFIGKHSTNIWLVHMQFYMIFMKDFVFMTDTVLGCFVIVMVLSIISSYIIKWILHYVYRFKITNAICSKEKYFFHR